MDCSYKKKNTSFCTCTYSGCPRKGLCCECLQYHLSANQLPGCCFSVEAEKTYDRSISNFVELNKDS